MSIIMGTSIDLGNVLRAGPLARIHCGIKRLVRETTGRVTSRHAFWHCAIGHGAA
jgi:hypothetical protein